jgi:hypothetical protein
MFDWIWIGLIVFASVLDAVFALGNGIPNRLDTLSGRMRAWGRNLAAVPLFMGVLCGHFWLPRDEGYLIGQAGSLMLLVGIACILSVVHVAADARRLGGWAQIAYVAAGVPLGHYLWPM